MPRLKVDDDELDIEELEEAEYEESDYEPYSGPQPPKGTILYGYIKKIWWTYNSNDVRMLVVIFEATEESGKYKGLGVWDRITLSTAAKFRWQPFLDAAGITLQDIKRKMIVEKDDENQGRPVNKIGALEIGDEEKAAIRIVTKRDRYNDDWETKVDKWLPWEDPQDEDDEDDEDFDEDDVEEEEEEPAPKRRAAASATRSGARTARKPAAKPARRREPEPEPEDEDEEEVDEEEWEDDEEEEVEEEPPAKPARKASARPAARATAKPAAKPVARSSRTGSAKPARSGRVAKATSTKGRSKSAGYDEEPPF